LSISQRFERFERFWLADADANAVRSGNGLVMHGGGHDAWCSFIVGKQHWRCGPRTWND